MIRPGFATIAAAANTAAVFHLVTPIR
jgi:hypothetical protein